MQINAWGKAHECFCGAWGFFHKDDDDAVVVIFNVLSCSITGARGSQVQIFWFVVCLFCVSLYGFTLCLSVVAVSSRLFLVCLYTGFFSSSCGPLGGALYVPCPFGGSAINRSVHLAPSLSGCWDSNAGALVCKRTVLTLLSNQRGGASCAGTYDIYAHFKYFYTVGRRTTVIHSNSHAGNVPLASSDMAFVDLLKYRYVEF